MESLLAQRLNSGEEALRCLSSEIRVVAGQRFEEILLNEFIETLIRLTENEVIIDFFMQISLDQGEELELGFFTNTRIVDITLSNGKVYSCEYPLQEVRELAVSEQETKWTLTILGRNKFDYNVLKPGSTVALRGYETALRIAFRDQ